MRPNYQEISMVIFNFCIRLELSMSKKSLSVVYVVPSLARTGVTNVVLGIAKGMVAAGNKVTVVALKPHDVSDSVEVSLNEAGVSIHVLSGNYLKKVFQFVDVLKVEHPNVVHTHAFKADLFVATLPNIPYPLVSTAHNIAIQDFTAVYGKIKGLMFATMQKLLYRIRFDAVYAVSKTVANYWRENGINTSVVYNGVEDKSNLDFEAQKNEFHYPISLVWTGRITKRKRLDLILEWIKNDSRFNITVVGNGLLYEPLFNAYGNADNITFVGRVQDVTSYVTPGKVFVSASSSEGLPMAAIEAMQNNLPLILSDIPQHKELSDGSYFGVQFFSNESEFFKDIDILTRNVRTVESRKIYNNKFTVSIMASNYMKQYTKIMEEKN